MSDNKNMAPTEPGFDSMMAETIWIANGQKPKKLLARIMDLYDPNSLRGRDGARQPEIELEERLKWICPGREYLARPVEGTEYWHECQRLHLDTTKQHRIRVTAYRSGVVFYEVSESEVRESPEAGSRREMSAFVMSMAVATWEPCVITWSELGMDNPDDMKLYVPENENVRFVKDFGDEGGNQAYLVCIAKNEGLYIKDWVDYHLGLGFSHVIIYDNNDPGSPEDFRKIFKAYEGKVDVEDVRGFPTWQLAAYTDAYTKLRNQGFKGWIAFLDVDEYLTFEDPGMRVPGFLATVDQAGYDQVLINWKTMSDSGEIKYSEVPMPDRFTEESRCREADVHVKCIVRVTDRAVPMFRDPHHVWDIGPVCNAACEREYNLPKTDKPCYRVAYIRHFHFKTIDEFCRIKMQNGWADTARDGSGPYLDFFKFNTLTEEKARYMLDRIYTLQKECRRHGIDV